MAKIEITKKDIKEECEDNNRWFNFLNEHGERVFGDYDFELYSVGYAPDIRCHGHLVGLKMAFNQLKGKI